MRPILCYHDITMNDRNKDKLSNLATRTAAARDAYEADYRHETDAELYEAETAVREYLAEINPEAWSE